MLTAPSTIFSRAAITAAAWETTMPGGAGRLDLMRYDPSSPSGVVEVLEVKGKWYKSEAEALGQAQGYLRKIRESTDHDTAERCHLAATKIHSIGV
jgi:hypothetical protein